MENRQLVTVRFKDPIYIGRALDAAHSISDGQSFESCNISLEFYDSMFFKVVFPSTGRRAAYEQYIPWTTVSTAFIEPSVADDVVAMQMDAVEAVGAPRKRGRPAKS